MLQQRALRVIVASPWEHWTGGIFSNASTERTHMAYEKPFPVEGTHGAELPHSGDAQHWSAGQPGTLLKLPGVLDIFPVSRSAWLAGVKAGRYPAPVRLSTRRVAWRAEEIRALVASL
jgi:prophage regulatory protein